MQSVGWPLYFVVPGDRFKDFKAQQLTAPNEEDKEIQVQGRSRKRQRPDPDTLGNYDTLWSNVHQYVLKINLTGEPESDEEEGSQEGNIDEDIYD